MIKATRVFIKQKSNELTKNEPFFQELSLVCNSPDIHLPSVRSCIEASPRTGHRKPQIRTLLPVEKKVKIKKTWKGSK